MTTEAHPYPTRIDIASNEVELHLMSEGDRDQVLEFAARLPADDLMFMRRDITQPEEVDAWLTDIAHGHVKTILATIDGELVGYATMHRSALRWSAHVAELRVVVAPNLRRIGLGRALTQEVFTLALDEGIEKMVAHMTLDQNGARRSFEELGFRTEAVLRHHVKDRHGEPHDLILMSNSVDEFHRLMGDR